MKKVVKITISSIEQYVRVLNGLFRLTDKEVLVIAKFIEKYLKLKDVGINVFTAEVKKQVAEELGMNDFNVLNIYIKSLKEKKALLYKNGNYEINSVLILKDEEEGVEFRWQKKIG